jgi:hypothetical protein
MTTPAPDLLLREQLTDLAGQAPAGTDLLDGALARAGRRRRARRAGTGLATAAVAAAVAAAAPSLLPLGDQGTVRPGGPTAVRTPVPLHSLGIGPEVARTPHGTPPSPEPPTVVGTVRRASALLFHGRDVDAVDAATGDRRRILRLSAAAAGQLPYPNTGSLSPDGTKLAVPSVALGEGASGVWVLDLPTGEGRRYATATEPIGSVSWSPDGTRLWALRWGGGGAWTLDVPGGTFTRIPGVAEPFLFWDGAQRLVTSDGRWRVVDPAGGSDRALPQLTPYSAGGPWAPAEFGGWSPDGRWLAVQRRDGGSSSFAAVDVSTGRVVRTWGPYPDELVTQNILGWAGPTTMVAMLRPAGSDTALRLIELDVETGKTHVRATYDDTDSAYLPAQPQSDGP